MFEALLSKLARGLDRRGIPYMLIGGQAVLLYGEPRLTRDVDVTLGVGPEKLSLILDLAKESGWKVLTDSPADFVAQTLVLPCLDSSSGIRIDLVFSFSAYERQAIERARPIQVEGTTVQYAAVEDVIIHKVVAGRPRDLEDVHSILLKNPQVDVAYIRRWLREFDAAQEEDLSTRFEEVWKARGESS
ncbi:MAG TPA: nucleotidyl transferase AbiEii/AbiGii toxin family protein [Candidatus Acidoferrales bacterium]|nr:nucleotidyl transferase AbiEii/AbiGii toxin family protein [Candidatus Acidoferrales bacterium]